MKYHPTKSFKVRSNNFVWCDIHGTVHERTRDPYNYGKPDCSKRHWRKVYIESFDRGEEF